MAVLTQQQFHVDQPDAPGTPGGAPLRWARLLGQDPLVREQTAKVVQSNVIYVGYGAISLVQVALGLLDLGLALALIAAGAVSNNIFYALVRSGRWAHGRDPGLARAQLVVGVLFMLAAYATLGPAATGLLVVMASHIVYSMFSMTPRQVWQLVGGTLAGLGAVMLACAHWQPQRYDSAVQLSSFLYALLVMPVIALLAHKVTGMTQRLKAQHAELQEALTRLHELATRDELTRTHNRRYMGELLATERARHARLGAPMALALIDIDLFKSVNDRHGHAVGDEVLRGFARFARDHLRAADQLARWGGEEFLVLMPHTGRDAALTAFERLQLALAQECGSRMPLGLAISFSAGVVELGLDEPLDAAIERADQAMYRAKTQGRARSLPG